MKESLKNCNLCLPEFFCERIGELGKIAARKLIIPDFYETIIWKKIEECPIRKKTI